MKIYIKMRIFVCLFILISLGACTDVNKISDAYGNFEAVETIISAQSQGEVLHLNLEKGMKLADEEYVGLIDTTNYYLQKKQLLAKKKAIETSISSILAEIEVLNEQKSTLIIEKKRLDELWKDGAATKKQMDEVNGQVRIIDSKIKAVRTKNAGILNEIEVINSQIEQVLEQLARCRIINPVNGTVLEKYIEPNELLIPGKAIYKIADLSSLDLRVYISGDQLSEIAIGDEVQVLIDKDSKNNYELKGTIIWISDRAEFTPKIIQTKKERVNMVYATLVRVKNENGMLKVGMPGEINFKKKTE